jgi:hypothetical protein
MVEKTDFSDYILPPADKMATAAIDCINYHRDTAQGQTYTHTLHAHHTRTPSSLTTVGIEVSNYQTEAELSTDGLDEVVAIAMHEADATFKDTCKVVLSLTSPLPLLYAATLKKITIHLTTDPISPLLLRIYRVPKSP